MICRIELAQNAWHYHCQAPEYRNGVCLWHWVTGHTEALFNQNAALIVEAAYRESGYTECSDCNLLMPPGHSDGDGCGASNAPFPTTSGNPTRVYNIAPPTHCSCGAALVKTERMTLECPKLDQHVASNTGFGEPSE